MLREVATKRNEECEFFHALSQIQERRHSPSAANKPTADERHVDDGEVEDIQQDDDDSDFDEICLEPDEESYRSTRFPPVPQNVLHSRSRTRGKVSADQLQRDHFIVQLYEKYAVALKGELTATIKKDILAVQRFGAWVVSTDDKEISNLKSFSQALLCADVTTFIGHVNNGDYGGTSNSLNLLSGVKKFVRCVKMKISTWCQDHAQVSVMWNHFELVQELLSDQRAAKTRNASSSSGSKGLTVQDLDSESSSDFYDRCAKAANDAFRDFQEMCETVVAPTTADRNDALTFIAGLMQLGQQPTRWGLLQEATYDEFMRTLTEWQRKGEQGGCFHTSAKHKTAHKFGDLTVYAHDRTMYAVKQYFSKFRIPSIDESDGSKASFFTTTRGTKVTSTSWNRRLNRFVAKYLPMKKWLSVTLLRKKLETAAAEMEATQMLSGEELKNLQQSDGHSSQTATTWYNERATVHRAMKGLAVFKKLAPAVYEETDFEKEVESRKRKRSNRVERISDPSVCPSYRRNGKSPL